MRVLAALGLTLVVAVVAVFLMQPPRDVPRGGSAALELEEYLFSQRRGPDRSFRLLPVPAFDPEDVLVRGLFRRAIETPVNQSRQLALGLARDRDWPWLVPAVGEAMLQQEGRLPLRDVPDQLAADPGFRSYVERGLLSTDHRVLLDACAGAGRLRLAGSVSRLVAITASEDEDVRRAAAEALARIGAPQGYAPLIENYFSRGDGVVMGHIVEWISEADAPVVGMVLDRYAAARERSSARHRALPLLRATQAPAALERLRDDGLASKWGRARYYAYLALVDLEDVETLRRLARDPDSPHRVSAAWGLAILRREDEEVVALLKEEVEKEIRAGTFQVFATPGGDHGLVVPWGASPECHLETIAALRTETDLYDWLWGLLQVPPGDSASHIHSRVLQALAIRSPKRAEPRLREVLDVFDPLKDDLQAPDFLRALDGLRLLATLMPESRIRLAELLETLPKERGSVGFPARAVQLILYGPPPAHAAEVATWAAAGQLRYRKLFTRYRRGGGTGLSLQEAENLAYETTRPTTK